MKFPVTRLFRSQASSPKTARAPGDGPISSRRKSGQLTTGGRWLLGLFFSVFLGAGIVATYAVGVRPWIGVWEARTWTPVKCRILSSGVRSHDGDSTTYSVAITYTYVIDGRAHTGDRYDFTTGSSSGRKAKRAIAARFRKGQEAVCYVNPARPTEAVLERERVQDWGFGLFPLVFVLVGAGGVYFAVFGSRKTGSPDAIGRVREAAFTRGDARGGRTDTDDPPDLGPVELKPVQSRVVKLVTILVVALFWNGIVSVFLVDLIGDVVRGSGGTWFFLLFLLPFVGVGLFLIGVLVRMTMALANPVPRLTVNRSAFAPGDSVELVWRFDGKAARLNDVRLFLEGREEATYRRGTDTKTDKEVFATLEIAAATGLSAGEPGEATLRLPERLMHSFKADNNAVIWALRVKGGIAWWPDVDEEFAFSIRPSAVRAGHVSPLEVSES